MTIPLESHDIELAHEPPVDGHPAALYLAQLGPGSRRTMTEALQKIAGHLSGGECDMRSLQWSALRIEHTSALRTRLAAELAPATANKHLAALRGVLKQVCRQGLISAEVHRQTIDLPAVHGPSPRKTRALCERELRALVAACERDRSPAGPRDAALLALIFGAGLRRAEVTSLDLADFDRLTSTIHIRGNGTRPPRRFTASREGLMALEPWTARRGVAPGPLFNPVNKGGRIENRRLSDQAIYVACHKRAAQAGLPPVSPEDLRRSLVASKSRTDKLREMGRTPALGVVQTA
ncbi:MAG: tyrosine-type recombinase/integrase [Deltaproteobacteria bacterium]|nr:tyrosine-type recombinase/integrase [Deltaproteobacteria bacterium]